MVLFQTVQRAEQAPSQEVPAEAEPVPLTAQILPPPKKEEGEEAPSTPQLLQPPKKEEGEEGEILSASPSSPAAKPMGKCYMDLEEGEVVGEGKEESKTESRRPDRWAGRIMTGLVLYACTITSFPGSFKSLGMRLFIPLTEFWYTGNKIQLKFILGWFLSNSLGRHYLYTQRC